MIRLCTYNIHGAVGVLDRKYNPKRISQVVQAIEADVYGLQEVRVSSDRQSLLDILAHEIGRPPLFLKTLTDRKGAYGNALISRFPILQHFDVDLEINAEQTAEKSTFEARRAIFARLEVGAAMPLWVIVTHLAVERVARHLQFEKMIRLIQEMIMFKDEPCVLMGDMNEWSRPVRFIKQLDQLFSRHLVRRTFPAFFPLLPLDRIWISRQMRAHRVWAYRGSGARLASDHLPLCIEVNCPD